MKYRVCFAFACTLAVAACGPNTAGVFTGGPTSQDDGGSDAAPAPAELAGTGAKPPDFAVGDGGCGSAGR